MPGVRVDGNDLLAMISVVQTAAARACIDKDIARMPLGFDYAAGSADTLECLLVRVGVSPSEYRTASQMRRAVH